MSYKRRNGTRAKPEVRSAMRRFRKIHKGGKAPCHWCGIKYKWWHRYDVHHLKPVSTHPELAPDMQNMRWVHKKCHFVACHYCNWKLINPGIDDQRMWKLSPPRDA